MDQGIRESGNQVIFPINLFDHLLTPWSFALGLLVDRLAAAHLASFVSGPTFGAWRWVLLR